MMLVACGPSANQSVARDIVVTDIERDGETVLGRYDPATFSEANVRKMLTVVCKNGAVLGFTPTSEGDQIKFAAKCANGSVYGPSSGTNFKKSGPNTVSTSTVFSLNGTLAQETGSLTL